ncbi:MAG: PepSY-like domain-containing protein [Bacteroidota bacterium]|nr:PepSY-like domain-containing protein [Bacteroidota bacterium]
MKYSLIIFLILLSFLVNAQENITDTIATADTAIAENVLNAFNKKYPKGDLNEWKMDGDNYIITFYSDNKWYDVSFSNKGKWLNTYIIIDYERLPDAVVKSFEKTKFNDLEIKKVVVMDNPDEKLYKIYVVDYDDNETELIYTEEGKLL